MKRRSVENILKKFKKKSLKSIKKETYTEFFYLNKSRRVLEFLVDEKDELLLNKFFKEFLPTEIREFCDLELLVDDEEVRSWYYEDENLILKIVIKWGVNSQEIFVEVDIENFMVSLVNNEDFLVKNIDVDLFKNYLINFLINQTESLSKSYQKILGENKKE